MRHRLADPHFPDIVGDWARHAAEAPTATSDCANDNRHQLCEELSDPFLAMIGQREIAATRLW